MTRYEAAEFVSVPLPTNLYQAIAARHPTSVSAVIEHVVWDFLDRTGGDAGRASAADPRGVEWGPLVLPEGTEERILRAAEIVLLRDVCDVTLLGEPSEVQQKASSLGLALEKAKILDPRTSELLPSFANAYYELRKHKGISPDLARDSMMDVSYFGTMMVHQGMADGMVSGSIHTTAPTIRPALEFVKTRPGISIVSSVFFMCLADQVLVYGDCALNPEPTPEQLADIPVSSAGTARAFGL